MSDSLPDGRQVFDVVLYFKHYLTDEHLFKSLLEILNAPLGRWRVYV